jgi:hypothetical protein
MHRGPYGTAAACLSPSERIALSFLHLTEDAPRGYTD